MEKSTLSSFGVGPGVGNQPMVTILLHDTIESVLPLKQYLPKVPDSTTLARAVRAADFWFLQRYLHRLTVKQLSDLLVVATDTLPETDKNGFYRLVTARIRAMYPYTAPKYKLKSSRTNDTGRSYPRHKVTGMRGFCATAVNRSQIGMMYLLAPSVFDASHRLVLAARYQSIDIYRRILEYLKPTATAINKCLSRAYHCRTIDEMCEFVQLSVEHGGTCLDHVYTEAQAWQDATMIDLCVTLADQYRLTLPQ